MPGDEVEISGAQESRDHEAHQRIQHCAADRRRESIWLIEETAASSGQLEHTGPSAEGRDQSRTTYIAAPFSQHFALNSSL